MRRITKRKKWKGTREMEYSIKKLIMNKPRENKRKGRRAMGQMATNAS